jgi:hypothetical protein
MADGKVDVGLFKTGDKIVEGCLRAGNQTVFDRIEGNKIEEKKMI